MNTSTNATTTRRLSGAALKAKRDKRIRQIWSAGIGAAVAVVAAIALIASFQHLRELGILAGQDGSHLLGGANLTPISIDVMLVIASIQLRRKGITRTARLIARICSLGGLILSMAGNVLVAWLTLPAGSGALQVAYTLIWSAVPVLGLLGATEMLTHTHKDVTVLTPKAKGRKASATPRKPVARRTKASDADATQLMPVIG